MRTSGILMPVSSLPSPYGIAAWGRKPTVLWIFWRRPGSGTGRSCPSGPRATATARTRAFRPLRPTPISIDLDALEQRGLLTHDEIARFDFGPEAPEGIDYGAPVPHALCRAGAGRAPL